MSFNDCDRPGKSAVRHRRMHPIANVAPEPLTSSSSAAVLQSRTHSISSLQPNRQYHDGALNPQDNGAYWLCGAIGSAHVARHLIGWIQQRHVLVLVHMQITSAS
jgi:hypothetical protein